MLCYVPNSPDEAVEELDTWPVIIDEDSFFFLFYFLNFLAKEITRFPLNGSSSFCLLRMWELRNTEGIYKGNKPQQKESNYSIWPVCKLQQ